MKNCETCVRIWGSAIGTQGERQNHTDPAFTMNFAHRAPVRQNNSMLSPYCTTFPHWPFLDSWPLVNGCQFFAANALSIGFASSILRGAVDERGIRTLVRDERTNFGANCCRTTIFHLCSVAKPTACHLSGRCLALGVQYVCFRANHVGCIKCKLHASLKNI